GAGKGGGRRGAGAGGRRPGAVRSRRPRGARGHGDDPRPLSRDAAPGGTAPGGERRERASRRAGAHAVPRRSHGLSSSAGRRANAARGAGSAGAGARRRGHGLRRVVQGDRGAMTVYRVPVPKMSRPCKAIWNGTITPPPALATEPNRPFTV